MSSAVCSVCYEDLKPDCEHLQAVAGCGHVFHELCFQQWLEYCRKPSCPVCKRGCTNADVHRLYFSTSGEGTQKPKSPQSKDLGDLQSRVLELETQLSVANLGLQTYTQQLKELDEQLANSKVLLDRSEGVQKSLMKERDSCKQSLVKLQEELKRCTNDRSQLLEKNTSLAKELASMKLVIDVNLSQEEVMRLSTIGQGKNKDDIIDTLTRSLVLRNKTYKDLVNKYSILDSSEKNAIRKSDKASEQLRRLKARVQELEKTLEFKENRDLRFVKQRSEQIDVKEITCGTHSAAALASSKVALSGRPQQQELPKPCLEQKDETEAPSKAPASSLPVAVRREAGAREGVSPGPPGDLLANDSVLGVSGENHAKKRIHTAAESVTGARVFQSVTSSSAKGSFILSGADGRGGRVTVLKPPKSLAIGCSNPSARQVKRCRPTNAFKGNGGYIDQFFGRLAPSE